MPVDKCEKSETIPTNDYPEKLSRKRKLEKGKLKIREMENKSKAFPLNDYPKNQCKKKKLRKSEIIKKRIEEENKLIIAKLQKDHNMLLPKNDYLDELKTMLTSWAEMPKKN